MAGTSVRELLREFRSGGNPIQDARRLTFKGVGSLDVYNPTSPFMDEGIPLLAARVEPRGSEFSRIAFFREIEGGIWTPLPGAPRFSLQDPFWARIGGELVLGGVEVFPRQEGRKGELAWRTILYRGTCLRDLRPFFAGPEGMKDIRLCETQAGSVALFTRPRGGRAMRGKIGFRLFRSLDRMGTEAIEGSDLLDQLIDRDWCGANQVMTLEDGRLGVLGHVARFSFRKKRHYYPAAFTLDPATGKAGRWRIIAERMLLPEGPAKRLDLVDVLFPGGLEQLPGGKARLYLGVSDAEAMSCIVDDPFADRARA